MTDKPAERFVVRAFNEDRQIHEWVSMTLGDDIVGTTPRMAEAKAMTLESAKAAAAWLLTRADGIKSVKVIDTR